MSSCQGGLSETAAVDSVAPNPNSKTTLKTKDGTEVSECDGTEKREAIRRAKSHIARTSRTGRRPCAGTGFDGRASGSPAVDRPRISRQDPSAGGKYRPALGEPKTSRFEVFFPRPSRTTGGEEYRPFAIGRGDCSRPPPCVLSWLRNSRRPKSDTCGRSATPRRRICRRPRDWRR